MTHHLAAYKEATSLPVEEVAHMVSFRLCAAKNKNAHVKKIVSSKIGFVKTICFLQNV